MLINSPDLAQLMADAVEIVKASAPTTAPRGGKYIRRWWTGDRWAYEYANDPSAAHGAASAPMLDDPQWSHSIEAIAGSVGDDPEKAYHAALNKALGSPGNVFDVANPGSGDSDLKLSVVSTAQGRKLRLTDSSGKKVKDFDSRGAYEMWYIGVANTTIHNDADGNPFIEVRPNVGKVRNGVFSPPTAESLEKKPWATVYHKNYPQEKRVKLQKWRTSKENAEKLVRRMITDQQLASGKSSESKKDEDGIKGDASVSWQAEPGSVADKIQSGQLKWRVNPDTGKRELDATRAEKNALIAQAAAEYYPILLSFASKAANNAVLASDKRTSFYGSTGKRGWMERFMGGELHSGSGKPDFFFPDETSPAYGAISYALDRWDPTRKDGVGFSGYLAGKNGTIFNHMRTGQQRFVDEVKAGASTTIQDEEGAEGTREQLQGPTAEQVSGSEHLQTVLDGVENVEDWTNTVNGLLNEWQTKAADYESEKLEAARDAMRRFNQLHSIDKPKFIQRMNDVLLDLVDWKQILGKSLLYNAFVAMLQEDVMKKAMDILTKDKNVAPEHVYSHKDGDEDSPKFYYTDGAGNLVRYTNAPHGHPDRVAHHGDASLHPSEPQFTMNPEYFTPEGKKLTRCPDCGPEGVEWNTSYSRYDPANMWAGRWRDESTGEYRYTYVDADLRSYPQLQIHQQNAYTAVMLPNLRQYVLELYNSDKIKDQMTALALVLLDQGRMRVVELATLTPADIQIHGSLIHLGQRQIYGDYKVRTAFEQLKKQRDPSEPLFSVPMQKRDGSVDQSLRRRIGPRYLSQVLEYAGVSLLGLQTYHASLCFAREVERLVSQYQAPWDTAVTQATLSAALEWGHDFTMEPDAGRVIQLTQAVLIDPVVMNAMRQSLEQQKMLYEFETGEVPPALIPIPYVSFDLTDLAGDEVEFSQWIYNTPIHEFVA